MNASADRPPPILTCDMTSAPDTLAGRLAEYRELFAQSLIGRDERGPGVRFRFRAGPGVADRVRDLAARERACCGFLRSAVTAHGSEVWWDLSAASEAAGPLLAELARLPDTLPEGNEAVARRFRDHGLTVIASAAASAACISRSSSRTSSAAGRSRTSG